MRAPQSANAALHLLWLQDFVAAKKAQTIRDPGPLELKLAHTVNVLANIRHIAKEEAFDDFQVRVAQLAAIYHDLARFDQYIQYGTFKDAQSRNHGSWAVKLLKRLNRLAAEDAPARKLIYTAIGLHNRLNLPVNLPWAPRLLTDALRDADKLDILRVMAEHLSQPTPYNPTVVLSLPDDPKLHSQKTIACALARMPGSYADLRSVNDLRLLLGTWFFSLRFASSRKRFARDGFAQQLVESLPANEIYGAGREVILDTLERARRGIL